MSSTLSIGEVATIHRGSIDPGRFPDTTFDLFSIPAFDDNRTPELVTGSEIRSNKTVLPPTGVLFSKLNPRINRVWPFRVSNRRKPVSSTEFVCLVPNAECLDLDYLAWRLRVPNIVGQLPVSTTAATKSRERISPKALLDLSIYLPPLEEQRRIVVILNRAARIEALRRRADERMREFVPALFVKMFGDPVENPMGWPRRRVGDVCDVQGGLQVTKKRRAYPLATPYLRVANVLRDRLALDTIKLIRLTDGELMRTRLAPGDLLIVEGHGNATEIGRVAVWDGRIQNCVHQNHLIRARPDQSCLLPAFAAAHLNSSSGRQHLLQRGKTTSGLNTITTSDVRACDVSLPPIDLQRRFAEIVDAVRALAKVDEFSTGVAATLMASLMSESLRGSG